MKNILKQGIHATVYTVVSIAILFSISAFILQKNGFDFSVYFYVAAFLQIIIAVMNTIIYRKQKPFIAVAPLLILDLILMLLFRAFEIKVFVLMGCTIILHFLIVLVTPKKAVMKKDNSNQLRRRYEKIRKKQHY